MLKLAFLPDKENIEIQKELREECSKMDYLVFINELMFFLNAHYVNTNNLSNTVFFVMNKIILDNIFKHIAQKSTHLILHQLSNNTFTKDLYVNVFYTNQILSTINFNLEDKTEAENAITRMLTNYIDELYSRKCPNLSDAILNMYDCMNTHFSHLDIVYYKFELMDYRQPMLLYTERNIYVHT